MRTHIELSGYALHAAKFKLMHTLQHSLPAYGVNSELVAWARPKEPSVQYDNW